MFWACAVDIRKDSWHDTQWVQDEMSWVDFELGNHILYTSPTAITPQGEPLGAWPEEMVQGIHVQSKGDWQPSHRQQLFPSKVWVIKNMCHNMQLADRLYTCCCWYRRPGCYSLKALTQTGLSWTWLANSNLSQAEVPSGGFHCRESSRGGQVPGGGETKWVKEPDVIHPPPLLKYCFYRDPNFLLTLVAGVSQILGSK